ncbi:MAG: cation diffusion facilitator family transporter [Gammaproteobacteria bacterium]
MRDQERYNAAKKVTLLGALSNFLLAVIKIAFGILGYSHALVADGVHSVADLLTDALVIIAARIGSQHADHDHPYGHQRIETAATVFLAILLILAGLGIMWNAGEHLYGFKTPIPEWYVLVIAALSILANEFLYHLTLSIGKKTGSQLLRANAWHHRSDAAASLVVLLGVGAALIGYPIFDPIAAIIVGLMIIKMGWTLGWNCLRELVDTAVEPITLEKIKEAILQVQGIEMIHQLRTRMMGDNILVDVHVQVDPTISVSEGHFITVRTQKSLLNAVSNISDVIVHVDPEDDEIGEITEHLPQRNEVLQALSKCWKNCHGSDKIQKIRLHYLEGKISVELYFSMEVIKNLNDYSDLSTCYKNAVRNIEYVSTIDVFLGDAPHAN